MIRSFLLLTIGISLYASSDYIPFSEFTKNKQIENNFINIEQKPEVKVNNKFKKKSIKYNYVNKNILKNTIKVTTSLSNFNSKSEQYIYSSSDGRKISQLTWNADNIKLFGLGLAYKTNNIEFYVNYKTNLENGNGLMDDYDWVYDSSPDTWTHWSHHENTQVKDIRILDLGITRSHYFDKSIKVSTNIGYKWEKQLFKAYDGSYIYSSSSTSLRDLEGNISGLGITYDQEYKGFYLGAEVEKKFNNIKFIFNTKYTPLMDVEFTDTHHLRVPAFTDYTSFDKTSMYSLGAKLDYSITSNQILSFAYDYTKYAKIKGNRIRSYVTGYDLSLPNTVGIESSNDLFIFEYMYKFQTK